MRMREVEIQCFKHRLWRSSRIHRTVVTFITFVMFVVLLYDCYWLMCSHHALRCGS